MSVSNNKIVLCRECGEESPNAPGELCPNCEDQEYEQGDFEDFNELAEDHGGRLE